MTQPEDPNNPSGPPPGSMPPPPPSGYAARPPGYPAAPPPGYPAAPPPGGQYGSVLPALPAGVELASRGRRTGAFFLALPLEIVTLVIGYLIWGAILWSKGQSPALKVLKCRVVDVATGQPVTWGRMALRDIVGGILQGICSIITLLLSYIWFLTDDRNRTLPDRIAKTIVVYDPNDVYG